MAYYKKGRRFNRQRAWAVRAWGNRRSYGNKAKGILGMSSGFILGVGVGMTDYDKQIPYDVKIALACLPPSVLKPLGSSGYQIQNFIKGMLIGDVIQARTGYTLGGSVNTGSGSSSNYGV